MGVEDALKRKRVAIVAAHPDDETIGAAGILPRMNAPVVLHVTDGSPRNLADAKAAGYETREDYARARRAEALAALRIAGVPEDRAQSLDLVDQEASFQMADLARRIAQRLEQVRPALVLTHPYEGGHPDHDATAFAVHWACSTLDPSPQIWEFTGYHARDGAMTVGEFLFPDEPGVRIPLDNEAREIKRRMYECFATQQHMLRNFPIEAERFRLAPDYDFTVAPHAGRLFYEQFDWGVTGERWRALADRAALELGAGVRR